MKKRLHISLGGSSVSDQQRRVSDSEFYVSLGQTIRLNKISLLQFSLLNLLANIHDENNVFRYLHLGIEKQVVIPQNSYGLAQLVTKLSDLLQAQSNITVTQDAVDNKIVFTFSQAIRFSLGEDSIFRRLGFSPANSSFTTSKTLHQADLFFNLAQTPTVYMQIVNCGFEGDLIQNQHFAIPNDSAFGSYLNYIAQKENEQQTISGDPINLNVLHFKLFDFDGHELKQGENEKQNPPLTMIIDVMLE